MAWLAGAGIQGGVSYGETDTVRFKAVVNRTSLHHLHASLPHLLGVDHNRLTYFHNGRRYRLTDVEGTVMKEILT